MKKGQITMFIILGILLLFLSGFVLFGMNKGPTSVKKSSSSPIENYVSACIERTAGFGLYQLGIHGGKIYDISNAFVKYYYDVSYAHDNGNVMPSLADSQKDLERYVNENLNAGAYSCIKDLNVFKNEYDTIEISDVNTTIFFSDDVTMVKVNMPVNLVKKGASKQFDNFEYKFNVRYKRIHSFINGMVDYTTAVPLSYNGVAGVNIHMIPYSENNVELYAVTDSKSKLSSKDYVFLTAVKGLRSAPVCGEAAHTIPGSTPSSLGSDLTDTYN